MAKHLRILTDTFLVQIDDEIGINYCLRQIGSATLVAGTGAYVCSYVDVTITGYTRPLVAVKADQAVAVACTPPVPIGGGQHRFRIFSQGNQAGQPVTYYVFDQPNGSSTAGCKLYNASGVCVFDAMKLPLRPVANTPTNSLATGQYAVLQNTIGSYMNPASSGGSQNYQYYSGFRVTSTGVIAIDITGYLWPANITMVNPIGSNILIIDVSNAFT